MDPLEWVACGVVAVVVVAWVWRGMARDQQRFNGLNERQKNEEWERDVW